MGSVEIESHWIAAGVAIVIALGGWNLRSTSELHAYTQSSNKELNGRLDVQDVRLESLKENFKIRTLDRYTATDASRDKSELKSDLNILRIEFKLFKSRVTRHIEACEGKYLNGTP